MEILAFRKMTTQLYDEGVFDDIAREEITNLVNSVSRYNPKIIVGLYLHR